MPPYIPIRPLGAIRTALSFDARWQRRFAAERTPPSQAPGISDRTELRSPVYHPLFTLRFQDGHLICVMRPELIGYDKHFWEELLDAARPQSEDPPYR